jgi:hypothetical protein
MGEFFGFIRAFQPPLPEGAGNMLDWGRPDYAEELLGKDFDLRFVEGHDPQVASRERRSGRSTSPRTVRSRRCTQRSTSRDAKNCTARTSTSTRDIARTAGSWRRAST